MNFFRTGAVNFPLVHEPATPKSPCRAEAGSTFAKKNSLQASWELPCSLPALGFDESLGLALSDQGLSGGGSGFWLPIYHVLSCFFPTLALVQVSCHCSWASPAWTGCSGTSMSTFILQAGPRTTPGSHGKTPCPSTHTDVKYHVVFTTGASAADYCISKVNSTGYNEQLRRKKGNINHDSYHKLKVGQVVLEHLD